MKLVEKVEQETAVALTRKEKLLRWAGLVRAQPQQMYLFHMLENWSREALHLPMQKFFGPTNVLVPNVFSLAAADPVFKATGLKADSVAASMEFFNLSQEDIHAFSCNCGGFITNHDMAGRIEKMANAAPAKPSLVERARSIFS